MSDDQVVKILEEIRELQKEQLENQKGAIARQKRLGKVVFVFVGVWVLFAGVTYLVPLLSYFFRR